MTQQAVLVAISLAFALFGEPDWLRGMGGMLTLYELSCVRVAHELNTNSNTTQAPHED